MGTVVAVVGMSDMAKPVSLLAARLGALARARKSRRAGVLAAAVLIYASGLLWPYEVKLPELVQNGAEWTSDRTLRFSTPGLALTPRPPGWLADAQATGRLRVTLRARSLSPDQLGPARLLTVSRDTYAQNVVIGQAGSDLVVRLLATCRGKRPRATGCRRQIRLSEVFTGTGWVDIELSIEAGRARLRADAAGSLVEIPLPLHPLRVWATDQRLAIGNDVSGSRPWFGEIAGATVETPSGSEDQLSPTTGLELPETFWLVSREPMLVPFRDASQDDMILNLLLYAPLGAMIGLLFARSRRDTFRHGSFFIILMSVTLEMLQLFISSRNSSVTDAFLNSVGGMSALVLTCFRQELWRCVAILARHCRRPLSEDR